VSGELFCSICGAVVAERTTSTTPTKKMLLDSRGGVGPRVTSLLHDGGIGTISKGRLLSSEERLLTRLLSEVFWIADKIGLPRQAAEGAGELARKAVFSKLVKRSRRPAAAALVYLSANNNGLCKSMEEIASAADVPLNQLNREVSRLVFGLNLRLKPFNVAALIDKLTRTLELPQTTANTACRIYQSAASSGKISGRKPAAISAAAVYLACRREGVKKPLSTVSEAAGVSVLTLRKAIALLESINNP